MDPGRPESSRGEEETSLHGIAGSAAERLREVLEAAERAAAGILEDAEAEARGLVEESRRRAEELALKRVRGMAELTDELIERAEAVKRRSDELIAALESTALGLDREPAETPPLHAVEPPAKAGEVAPPRRESSPPEPPPAESPSEPAPSERAEGMSKEAALLLATQMAVAGSSREEIERRLRDDLGIQSPSEILDGALDADRRA